MAEHTNNEIPDDTDANAKLILSILPAGALRKETFLTLLTFLIAAALDIAVNWQSVGNSFALNEYGIATGPIAMAVGFSFLTVLAWLFCGGVYAAGHHRAAGGLYFLVVAIIAWLIAPVATAQATERWAGLGFDPSNLAFWQQAFGLVFMTLLISLPGLLVCWCEQRGISLWHRWGIRAEAVELLRLRADAHAIQDARNKVAQELENRQRNKEADITAIVEQVEQDINAQVTGLSAEAGRQKHNVRLNKAQRQEARDRERAIGLVKNYGAVVLAVSLLLAAPAWAAANPVDDLLRKAPTLLILLDNTGGSPALEPSMIPHIERRAVAELERLPVGSEIVIFSVGDPRQISEIKRFRLQSRVNANGGPVSYLKHALHAHLAGFPARQNPKAHKESHLVGGWHDAALLLNPHAETQNFVLFATDGMEFSSLANCYKACALPKPTFTLPNTNMTMLGIGFGQSSEKTLAIFQQWRRFFAEAGIPNTQLLHVF